MTPQQIELMLRLQADRLYCPTGGAIRSQTALIDRGFLTKSGFKVTAEGHAELKKHFTRWEVRKIGFKRYIIRPGGFVVGELYDNLDAEAFEATINQ